jgi:hypothetical protein
MAGAIQFKTARRVRDGAPLDSLALDMASADRKLAMPPDQFIRSARLDLAWEAKPASTRIPVPVAPEASKKALLLRSALLSSLVVYSLAEGATEGYTWASEDRRRENRLIEGRYGDGRGVLDYHAWRSVGQVGVLGAIMSGFFLAEQKPKERKLIRTLVAGTLLSYFVFERALNYVASDDLFPRKGDYHVMGLKIPRSQAVDVLAGLGGIYLTFDL